MISDLLAAASLLLTVLAVLYGLWYPEMAATLAIRPALHLEDSVADRRAVKRVLTQRALPLAMGSLAVTVVFTPDAARILWDSVTQIRSVGWSFARYDAVRAAFLLVTMLTGGLCIHTGAVTVSLVALSRRLRVPIER